VIAAPRQRLPIVEVASATPVVGAADEIPLHRHVREPLATLRVVKNAARQLAGADVPGRHRAVSPPCFPRHSPRGRTGPAARPPGDNVHQPLPGCSCAFVGQWTSLREDSYAYDSAPKVSGLARSRRHIATVSIGEYLLENGPGCHWCAVCDIWQRSCDRSETRLRAIRVETRTPPRPSGNGRPDNSGR
jgi:hypothetical protein